MDADIRDSAGIDTGNVAVVTGGTGHLGRALVPMLVRRNFRLAVTYLIPDEATRLEEELELDDDRLLLRRVDCTDGEAVNRFMKETSATFGQINVVCCLVGGWAGGRDVAETDDVRFDRMLDLNLRSAFYTIRAAIPHLLEAEWGRIIAVASRAAFDPPTGQAAFNVAKAGVVALGQDGGRRAGGHQHHLQRHPARRHRHRRHQGRPPLCRLRQLAEAARDRRPGRLPLQPGLGCHQRRRHPGIRADLTGDTPTAGGYDHD